MTFNTESISTAISQMPSWEIIATLLGVAYVILAAKESLWTWFFGFISTFIYTILFWEGALFSSSLLNFYYMVMAIYGFILWRGKKGDEELKVSSYTFSKNINIIVIGLVVTVLLGYLTQTYTEAKFVYLDAFVLTFSVIGTWMLANKVLENWLYWIVTDSIAVVLYFKSGYLATVVLFIVYILLAFWGYYSWSKDIKAEKYSL